VTETQYTAAFNKKLHPGIYSLNLCLRYISGVADCWYSAEKGDLWVEWKYKKEKPKQRHKPALSSKQQNWLNSRYDEGRRVLVIVAFPGGGLVYADKSWNEALSAEYAVSKEELVTIIEDATRRRPLPVPFTQLRTRG
jgi:hypothetical protein